MTSTIAGLVIETKYRGTTKNANPTYDVTLSTPTQGYPGTVTMSTKPDVALNYGITNSEYTERPHVFEVERGRLVRDLGPAD